MKVKSLQSCPTLSDTMDCSPPGSSVHGIPRARVLEWVAVSFSRDLPSPGTEARSLLSPALTGGFRPLAPPVLWEHAKAEKSEPWGVKGSLEFLALEEG